MFESENIVKDAEPPGYREPDIRVQVQADFCSRQFLSDFRLRFFPESSWSEWNNWHWQIRNCYRTLEGLSQIINLSEEESAAIVSCQGIRQIAITPYYTSLLARENEHQSLRRTVIPVMAEFIRTPGESDDPLAEEEDSPVPSLVHRYPDRVLFLANNACSTYCRYCTRSRRVGKNYQYPELENSWEQAIAYIESNKIIRDVLISGGDPLIMPDEVLDRLLARLRRISHVEIIRIGTKVPAVLPQRITPTLVSILKKYHPLWMSVHFTHPDELTPEVACACGRLSDSGIPLGSQTVLLAGVNDSSKILKQLFLGLLKIRVRPYYLYQCDPITGSSHFRTPVERGLEIMKHLRGFISGYAVPTFVIDAPGGGGKIPILPDYIKGRAGNDLILTNYEGKTFRYFDNPCPEHCRIEKETVETDR